MGKGRSSKGRRVTIKAVREAAFACEGLDEAGARLGIDDLDTLLTGRKTLAAAWERGQLLRRVRQVASETVVVPERADKLLCLPKGTFAEVYAKDRYARELWDRHRTETYLSIERALVARLREGDARAVAAVEHLFGHRGSDSETDWQRLTTTQVEAATGIARAMIHRWHKEHGLPRNADGSYSMARLVAWLRAWERDKGGGEPTGLNPMQAEKVRRYRMENDETAGRLIERDVLMRILTARAAWLRQLLSDNRAEDWSQAHEGQTAPQLKAAYLTAFREALRQWKEIPESIVLPAEARRLFEEGLRILATEDTEITEKGIAHG